MYKIIDIIKNFNYKKLIVPSIFLLLYVFSFIYFYYKIYDKKEVRDININDDNISLLNEEQTIKEIEYIYVDIKGYVKSPNVYKIEKGSRVIDLINMSGGLKKNANTRFINLSKVLNDGDAIVIYSDDEIKKAQKNETIIVQTPCVCEEVKNDACVIENINNESSGKVNINTANIEELMTLNGIGEAKAKSIIEYREKNGNFNIIEELVNVSGISETIFSKIKENITV